MNIRVREMLISVLLQQADADAKTIEELQRTNALLSKQLEDKSTKIVD